LLDAVKFTSVNQWHVLVLTLTFAVYTLFEKNKIKFGQKFLASPKIGLSFSYENTVAEKITLRPSKQCTGVNVFLY